MDNDYLVHKMKHHQCLPIKFQVKFHNLLMSFGSKSTSIVTYFRVNTISLLEFINKILISLYIAFTIIHFARLIKLMSFTICYYHYRYDYTHLFMMKL